MLAKKASRIVGWSVFQQVAAIEISSGWVKAIAAEHPLILAGVGEQPEYCVTDSSVWRKGAKGEPEELFRLSSIVATHWMGRDLWQNSEEVSWLRRMQKAAELKEQEGSTVEVELDSGNGVVLKAAGFWLMRFLERCSHYNVERRCS